MIDTEGWIKRVPVWNKGFYYMAKKANVPIVVSYLDYEKKEMGVKEVIYNIEDFNTVMKQINRIYKDVKGKNPDRFVLQVIE